VIAVTGVGAVTALGSGVDALFAGLCAGRSALAEETLVRPARGPVGAVLPQQARRSSELAMDAARQAVAQAGLRDTHRLAVVGASTSGDMSRGEAAFAQRLRGQELTSPKDYLWAQLCHVPTQRVCAMLETRGPRRTLSTACTSGTVAVSSAADLIRLGRASAALVVGSDALCEITLAGFGSLGVYSPEPTRPFDAHRQGMNIGEGAGALLLEDLDAALARGARPLALLSGAANTSDAHHLSAPQPDGEGARRAIRAALGGLDPREVGYVSAHATGTELNDAMEAAALSAELPQAAISGQKGAIGHTLGAAGALEAIVAICALDRGRLPPNVGCQTSGFPELDLVESTRDQRVDAVMSVNFAFGGHNAALLFTRPA
jgi:3-oxoacyl-[acyl-carrier-protein] synthase II